MKLMSKRKTNKIKQRVVRQARKNLSSAARRFPAVIRSNIIVRKIVNQIRSKGKLFSELEFDASPPITFIYVSSEPFIFPFYGLAAIETARRHHPTSPILFIYTHEPFGEYWDYIKPHLVPMQIPDFNYYGPAKLNHYAHKADIIRLLALRELGGIYLDLDTVCVKPFHSLLKSDFTMGVQAACPGAAGGLCNATIVARPHSRFVKRWLKYYLGFYSKGHDQFWDLHSVKLPYLLAARHPTDIHVLPHDAFFFPLWHRLADALFKADAVASFDLTNTYSIHLWHNVTKAHVDHLDANILRTEPRCLYAKILGDELLNRLAKTQRGALMAESKVAAFPTM